MSKQKKDEKVKVNKDEKWKVKEEGGGGRGLKMRGAERGKKAREQGGSKQPGYTESIKKQKSTSHK